MAEHVQVADDSVPFDDALAVVVGYCLGQESVEWRMPRTGVGDPVDPGDLGAFAYCTYDCIRGSSGTGLKAIDILLADGLNAQMRARNIAAALAVAPEVSEYLAQIDEEVRFWDLARDDVSERPESETAPGWPLWRAWTVLISAPGIERARTHKILHHKRPDVFPLLDNETADYVSPDPWGKIHDDLLATADAWESLEDQLNDRLRGEAGCVELTRLRLHDILLWCRATGRTTLAQELGAEILARGD